MKVLVMIKGDGADEDKIAPTDEMFAVMNVYNEQLVNAGIMLAGEGLQPSRAGAKVVWDTSGEVSVVDGPFAEAKEIIAGYWIWQVSSLDEAVEWAKRCPSTAGMRSVLEIRPFFEMEDFAQVVSPEVLEREQAIVDRLKAAAGLMSDARRTVEVIWRIESPRLIASLTRLVRDVGLAEELAQDAFVAALEQWPVTGVPDKPGAWLMVDGAAPGDRPGPTGAEPRRQVRGPGARRWPTRPPADRIVDEPIGDDLLSLVFLTCHPVLPRESRIALTLRLFGGLTTDEIARAYLVPSPTIGQRISRAKRTLAEAQVPFEVPQADDCRRGVGSVLEVVYLIFTEGHASTSGDRWVRRDLADEAMRLGRVLAGLLPREPEVHGLVALMELQASRFDARGDGVLLQDQDRRRWDRTLIEHGLGALDRSISLRPAARSVHRAGGDRGVPQPGAVVRGRPTGRRSSPSTTRWRSWPRRRWSSSTGRSRCCTRTARRRRSTRSTRCTATRGMARYHLYGAVRGGRAAPARAGRRGGRRARAGGRPGPDAARAEPADGTGGGGRGTGARCRRRLTPWAT